MSTFVRGAGTLVFRRHPLLRAFAGFGGALLHAVCSIGEVFADAERMRRDAERRCAACAMD